MSAALQTDTDVAELLGLTPIEVQRLCREKGWPHVKPKRSVWRFTPEQVAQIIAMQTRGGGKKSKATRGGNGRRSL